MTRTCYLLKKLSSTRRNGWPVRVGWPSATSPAQIRRPNMPTPLGHDIQTALAAQTLSVPYAAGGESSAVLGSASFLTLGTDPSLTSERVFSPDATLNRVDNGAGNTYSLGVKQSYAFTWSAQHVFNSGLQIAAGQLLQFGTDVSLTRKAATVLGLGAGDAFESPIYNGGTAGWHIDANGNAEFNTITARGE